MYFAMLLMIGCPFIVALTYYLGGARIRIWDCLTAARSLIRLSTEYVLILFRVHDSDFLGQSERFWGVAEQSIRFCGRMTQNQNVF
jgi:hypothetical protein